MAILSGDPRLSAFRKKLNLPEEPLHRELGDLTSQRHSPVHGHRRMLLAVLE
jgi:hypothetical protein